MRRCFHRHSGLLFLALIAATLGPARPSAAQDTAFRFQGQFSRNGQLLQGPCDFRFGLFDAPTGGNQIRGDIEILNVNVTNGWVGRGLDFGADAFKGEDRFLQIAVRSPAGSGAFTNFPGRQKVRPVPYALHAIGPWQSEDGNVGYTDGAVVIRPDSGDACLVLGSGGDLSGLPNGSSIFAGPFTNPDNDHTYYVTTPTDWDSAESIAVGLGGHLVTINDAQENTWVDANVVAALSLGSCWIGLNDAAAEGNFVWADGSPVGFVNWGGGEPNGGGTENHVEFLGGGQWNDAFGGGPRFGLVELDLILNPIVSKIYRPTGTDNLIINNNSIDALTIDGQGRVGIGDSTPRRLLDLRGPDVGLALQNSNEPEGNRWTLDTAAFAIPGIALVRYANDSADDTKSVFVNDNGNVGIGVFAPGGKLDILGGADNNGSNDPGALAFSWRGGGYRHWIRTRHNASGPENNEIDFFLNTSASAGGSSAPGTGNSLVMSLANEGNQPRIRLGAEDDNNDEVQIARVNIADDDTGLFLLVGDSGDASDRVTIGAASGSSSIFGFHMDGSAFKPGGGDWTASCDKRLKSDIQPLSNTLDRLLSLHGYSFNYLPEAIADGRGLAGPQIGLIAQEVQAVFPGWVSTDSKGHLAVTERGSTALMVEALRDLRHEKDEQIAALAAENDDLRRRLEALEAAVARLAIDAPRSTP